MSSENWYFTADTNAKGYTYIKAYQTEWDPVRKRSRSINRRHVGRLHEDGHVTPSPGFLASFLHNPEIFVREIQTLRTLVRHFHTGAILKSHTAVHIFSYENPEITYTEQEKY